MAPVLAMQGSLVVTGLGVATVPLAVAAAVASAVAVAAARMGLHALHSPPSSRDVRGVRRDTCGLLRLESAR